MPKLKRALGLPSLIVYGVGSMVGAGIYSIIGPAAIISGNNLWLSFILASIAAAITVLSYAELSSMYPKAGAEFQFLKHAFPSIPYLSFMAGFLIALNAAATSATVSLAFAGYLKFFISNNPFMTALLLLVSCTIINIAGIKQSTWTNIVLVIIEVSGLFIIIWTGFENGNFHKPFQDLSIIRSQEISDILSVTALIFFVYIGFEDIANLSEETNNALHTVPKALIYSVIITSIIYILVAFAFIMLADTKTFYTTSPLSTAVSSISNFMGIYVAIAALFATASTALITLVSISRMIYGMANEAAMPKIFASVLPNRKTPWIAALFLFLWAILLLFIGNISTIASVSSMGVLLVFMSVQIALITLRFTQKNQHRNFKIPINLKGVPLLSIFGIFIIILLLTQFPIKIYWVVGLTILVGTLFYFINSRT